MRESVTMMEYGCDKPECDVVHRVQTEVGLLPEGVDGSVRVVVLQPDGTSVVESVDFYACRLTHLRDAVKAVMEADHDDLMSRVSESVDAATAQGVLSEAVDGE